MTTSDSSQRFVINDSGIRGQWTLLETSFQTVLAKKDYPIEIQSLLGELMAAAILITSTLKFEGIITIQARGDGPVSLLTVECTHNNHLRAIARWEGDTSAMDFKTLLSDATLAITITPAKGQRYQGIVPLQGNNLSECLEHYFQSSEQLKTQIQLFHGNNRAGGLLLQVLPQTATNPAPQDQMREEWERMTTLASTLTAEELLNLDCATILNRLFHAEKVQLFDAVPVLFQCTCSRQRTSEALAQLGESELQSILQERGKIDVTCQFCNQHYGFDSVDVAMLLRDQSELIPPNTSH